MAKLFDINRPNNIITLGTANTTIRVASHTASLLLSLNGSKDLESVADLTAWVAGTANQITVTDDTDGTITLSVSGLLEDLATLGANSADSEFIVGTGVGALTWESGATARTSLELGTGNSPTFAGLSLTGNLSASKTDGDIYLTAITTGAGNYWASVRAVCDDNQILIGAFDDGYTDATEYIGNTVVQAIGGDLILDTFTATKVIKFYTGGRASGNLRATITDTAAIFNDKVGIGGAVPTSYLTFGTGKGSISLDTSNGFDDSLLYICGGGATTYDRGAIITLKGNEQHTAGGSLTLEAGNAATADIFFLTNGLERMIIDYNGNVGIGTPTFTPQEKLSVKGIINVPKASGNGIKVDITTPTFGWRDLEGFEIPDPTGGDRPTLSTYSGGSIKENAFSNGDVLRIRYHIPHDYVKGTDIFSHIHWSHNGTAISGNVVFGITSDYTKGHNQANFGTEKSISITYATTNISTTPRYRHRIEESAITNDGGSATLIDRGLLEPDGIILVTFELTTNPTITGGSPNNVFVHRADLHYQSSNIATKDKVPDFYA